MAEERRVQLSTFTPVDTHRVVCLGEALVLVCDEAADANPATAHLGGAEANVAAGLAARGIPTSWVGRVGKDAYGDLIRSELGRRGVDVSAVESDPDRPTGYYRKRKSVDPEGEHCTESEYHRAGSAASAMGPQFLDQGPVRRVLHRATVIHCSGITAALSESCAALMQRLVGERESSGALISFDVNWREQLWPHGDPGMVVELARLADIVFVGADEAVRVFGSEDPAALRRILPGPRMLVIKDGARGALAVDIAGRIDFVPALTVDVVEPIGAGDAFAAGFLAGMALGEEVGQCLRRGHIGAAATLTVEFDSAPQPPAEVVAELLSCPESVWATTRVDSSGFVATETSGD
ncbi:sugar kinase [Rhodococcus sp. ABRD24]|nr:sugar kinase [Rhodococcus sp. ABRD24]QBJ95881.1 sugar kinase [Rhodococcus sp. ABRD24]